MGILWVRAANAPVGPEGCYPEETGETGGGEVGRSPFPGRPRHCSSLPPVVVYNLTGSLGKIESLIHSRPENQKGGTYGAQEAWKRHVHGTMGR